MSDLTTSVTYYKVPSWHGKLLRFCDKEIPIVVCGNKVDLKDRRQVKPEQYFYPSKKNLQKYEDSDKTNYNVEKPFLYLARKLTRDADLHFVESPALFPTKVQIDLAAQAQNEAELVDAASQPPPDDYDRFE